MPLAHAETSTRFVVHDLNTGQVITEVWRLGLLPHERMAGGKILFAALTNPYNRVGRGAQEPPGMWGAAAGNREPRALHMPGV